MIGLTRDELDIRFDPTDSDARREEELKELPSLFGGDGLSIHSPIFVNAVSRAMAKRLVTSFIERMFGKEGTDWKLAGHSHVVDFRQPDVHMEHYVVETLDGEKNGLYFDLSRSHGNGLRLLRQAYELRVVNGVGPEVDLMQ